MALNLDAEASSSDAENASFRASGLLIPATQERSRPRPRKALADAELETCKGPMTVLLVRSDPITVHMFYQCSAAWDPRIGMHASAARLLLSIKLHYCIDLTYFGPISCDE